MSTVASNSHPYFPSHIKIPRYAKNELASELILQQFGTAAITICVVAFALTFVGRRLPLKERLVFVWFILCGTIHTVLEGYYCYFHRTIASKNTLLAQVWKEYSLSDSRYLISDPTVLGIEFLTAFIIGPACFILAMAIMRNWSFRHLLQMTISIPQLYGTVLYMWTELLHKESHSNPDPQYFFVYFVLFNIPWLVIPTWLTLDSYKYIRMVCKDLYK